MISLLLSLLTLILSAIVVRIGAIALELTGLPEEQASFQSLSSFSGVGYTTREAEFVLSHPRRRLIIKTLIIMGSAGIITTVATLGGTLLSSGSILTSMTGRPLARWLPLMSLAPPIALNDQHGRRVTLADYDGRNNVIIAFYPKDQSFICSRQLAEYSEHLNTIHGLDTEVLAINPESEKSHASFCDASDLKFPVLSDRNKSVCRAYRALMLGGLIVDRTVYILDRHGLIRYAKRGRPSLPELLRTLLTINHSSSAR